MAKIAPGANAAEAAISTRGETNMSGIYQIRPSARIVMISLIAAFPASGIGAAAQTPAASADAGGTRVLVLYHSRTGTTQKMAEAVADGARQVTAVTVLVKRVEEATKDDLQAADAIALGCPTYFANIPGSAKQVMDTWNWKWKVDFTDKVGGAFATGGGPVGGKEHTIVSLLLFMINNRMVVAGPLYQDEEGEDIWGEPGAAAMTGPLDPGVSNDELDSGRNLGERLARLAKKLRGG
jgi:NAD(P)H dehydrogenase (quinone)